MIRRNNERAWVQDVKIMAIFSLLLLGIFFYRLLTPKVYSNSCGTVWHKCAKPCPINDPIVFFQAILTGGGVLKSL